MSAKDTLSFLEGGGRSADLLREIDWTSTPLGPPETWSIALKTALGVISGCGFPAAIAWGPERTTLHNEAFRTVLGDTSHALGLPFHKAWQHGWDVIGPLVEAAHRGDTACIEDLSLAVGHGGYDEETFFTFNFSPLRDETGAIAGMLATATDTTPRVETERQFRLMNSELHHRIKNMFATVTSIASQTLRTERPLPELRTLLLQRLTAIAAAQSLLIERPKANVPVREVMETALSPHNLDKRRVTLTGGDKVTLNDKQSLSLSLVVNELVTNAIKYGALSKEGGHVEIAWDGTINGPFNLSWTETGGPAVIAPTRRGFGTTLMERVAPHDFGGTGKLGYAETGVTYRLYTDRLQV